VKFGFIIFTDLSKQTGDAIHVKNLLREFESAGIELGVFTSKLETIQFKSKQLNFIKKMLGRSIVLLRILTIKKRYELFYLRDWLFAYLMSFCKLTYVFEVNGLVSYEGLIRNYYKRDSILHKFFKKMEKRVLARAMKIVCVSEGIKNYCLAEHIDKRRILVAENAADVDTFNPDVPKTELETEDGKITIGWMGSFKSQHGFKDLLTMAAYLKSRNCTTIRFLVIGGGRRKDDLENQIAEQNLEDYFTFCGGVDWNEVPGYMLNADFCLSLYKRSDENLEYRKITGVAQIKIFEYLALGKPVLAYDHADASDFFEKRKIGWVCAMGPENMADKIAEIVKKPEQIAEYTKNALALSRARYSWKLTAKKIIDFLEQQI
jgi:glycosyltransferase involved in cell wall biosynthesis